MSGIIGSMVAGLGLAVVVRNWMHPAPLPYLPVQACVKLEISNGGEKVEWSLLNKDMPTHEAVLVDQFMFALFSRQGYGRSSGCSRSGVFTHD